MPSASISEIQTKLMLRALHLHLRLLPLFEYIVFLSIGFLVSIAFLQTVMIVIIKPLSSVYWCITWYVLSHFQGNVIFVCGIMINLMQSFPLCRKTIFSFFLIFYFCPHPNSWWNFFPWFVYIYVGLHSTLPQCHCVLKSTLI